MFAILAAGLWTTAARAQDEPYRDLICSYEWDCAKAMRVMLCESRGDPHAYSQGNLGLWQINIVHRGMVGGDVDQLYDPDVNTRVAHDLWLAQGWGPWVFCGTR